MDATPKKENKHPRMIYCLSIKKRLLLRGRYNIVFIYCCMFFLLVVTSACRRNTVAPKFRGGEGAHHYLDLIELARHGGVQLSLLLHTA